MNPLSPSPAMLAGLATFVVVALGALYLVRRGRRVTVPSLVIWQRLDRPAQAPRWRPRWWMSLALALLVSALTLASIVPPGGFAPAPVEDWLLVIDTSPSMHARTADGRRRVEHAQALAAQRLRDAPPGTRAMLVDTTSQYPRQPWAPVRTVLGGIGTIVSRPIARPAAMPVAPQSGLPRRTVLFSDGVAPLPAGGEFERVSVLQPADNVGLVSFAVRSPPGEPGRGEAVLRIVNGSPTAKTIEVSIGAGDARRTRRIVAATGEERAESLDVSSLPAGPIEARVSAEGDAFDFDDRAYAVLPDREPLPVLLVSASGARLETALRLLPGITLRAMDPARFAREGAGDASVVVLDGVLSAASARLPSIVFGAADDGSAVADLPGAVTVVKPGDALASGVAWGDVHVTRSRVRRAGQGTVVAAAHDRGIELVGFSEAAADAAARIDIRFRLEDSNLATQGRFPAFLGAAIDRLDPRPRAEQHAPGLVHAGPVPVPVRRQSDGTDVPVFVTDEGHAFVAETPGIYRLESTHGRRDVVISHADPAISLINRSSWAPAAVAESLSAPRTAEDEPGSWRWLLLVLAIAVLVIEAIAFTRRRTE